MRLSRGVLILLVALGLIAVETYYLLIAPLTNETEFTLNQSQYWALAVPVYILVLFSLLFVFWIGYTMVRTKEPIRMSYEQAYEEAIALEEDS